MTLRALVRDHWPDALILLLGLALALLVMLVDAGCAHAEPPKEPDPFKLACPDTLKCGTARGFWVPTGYLHQLGADVEKLAGCEKNAATYQGELDAQKTATSAATLRVRVLEEQLVSAQASLDAMTRARDDDRRLIATRTRWAVVMTALVVVVAGVAGGSYYAAQH